MDIADTEDVELNGVALVGGADIFRQHTIPIRNAFIINITGDFIDATVENLGSGVRLIVIPELESLLND